MSENVVAYLLLDQKDPGMESEPFICFFFLSRIRFYKNNFW